MRTVFYVDCFSAADKRLGLHATLPLWIAAAGAPRPALEIRDAATPDALRDHVEEYLANFCVDSMLVVGAHGHASRKGFVVDRSPVRWHDLAFLLRGRMNATTAFLFYSCNGGYPGIMHAFGRTSGPAFVFGPRKVVSVRAMRYATTETLTWCHAGMGTNQQAVALVNRVNAYANQHFAQRYADFFRVIWGEGAADRHPAQPDMARARPGNIALRGWGGI